MIPKKFFRGVKEVEIRRDGNRIYLIPLTEKDPLSQLGTSPVVDDIDDASENHDKYITQP